MIALCKEKHSVAQATGGHCRAGADSQAVGSLLGIKSAMVAKRVLQLWRQRLSEIERGLLMDYDQGGA